MMKIYIHPVFLSLLTIALLCTSSDAQSPSLGGEMSDEEIVTRLQRIGHCGLGDRNFEILKEMGEKAYPALCKELELIIINGKFDSLTTCDIISLLSTGNGDKIIPRKMIRKLIEKRDLYSRKNIMILVDSLTAIGRIGTKEDVPMLLEFLDDKDNGMSYTSLRSLTKIGDESAMPKIEAWIAKRRASLGKEKSEKDLAIQEAEKAITAIQMRSKASPKTIEITGSSTESKSK